MLLLFRGKNILPNLKICLQQKEAKLHKMIRIDSRNNLYTYKTGEKKDCAAGIPEFSADSRLQEALDAQGRAAVYMSLKNAEMPDAEFEALKEEFNKKLKNLPEDAQNPILFNLNKYNIKTVLNFLDKADKDTDEDFIFNVLNIFQNIENEKQAEIADKILSRPDLCGNNIFMQSAHYMLKNNVYTYKTALKILSSPCFYADETFMNFAANIIPDNEYAFKAAEKILNTPELYKNEKFMENACSIMPDNEYGFKTAQRILSSPDFYDNKAFMKYARGIMPQNELEYISARTIMDNAFLYADETFMEYAHRIKNRPQEEKEKIFKILCSSKITQAAEKALLKGEETAEKLVKLIDKIGADELELLSENDTITAVKFLDLYNIKNISEIPHHLKKDILHMLVSSNSELFSISDKMKEMFPLLPKNQEEYCALLPAIAQSLDIKTNTLSQSGISTFFDNLEKTAQMLASMPEEEFKELNIRQEYSKNDFIKDVLEIVKDLTQSDKRRACSYFGFDLYENEKAPVRFSIEGCPYNSSGAAAGFKDSSIIEKLRKIVIKFSENNKILCRNKELETQLNSIIEAMPELRPAIGSIQHGTHAYDIFTHSLKVLKGIVQTPEYQKLNDSDKRIMQLSALLHDITKKEGQPDKTHPEYSAFDASYIAKKFNLADKEETKLYTLIKHHEWLKYANTAPNAYELGLRLKSIAYDFRNDNIFDMSIIFTHGDLKAVNDEFHDKIMNTGLRLKNGEAADFYADKIREYIKELKISQPLLPVTPFPKSDRIEKAVKTLNSDGSTNIKGVYKDKDGLIVIKFNELQNEDLEKIGFSKESTVSGTKGKTKGKKVNKGSIKFFVHGLEKAYEIANFDAFSHADSEVLLSVSYADRPESKYRFFKAQGVILDCDSGFVHGGGFTDAGSGTKKCINDFKHRYIYSIIRKNDRTYISNLIKKTLNLNDEEYVRFVKDNENKPLSGIEPKEARIKLINAFVKIRSSEKIGNRSYNEMYISNPKPPMAVFAYSENDNKIDNPLEFLNGGAAERTKFLRAYALEHNIPFVVFGN